MLKDIVSGITGFSGLAMLSYGAWLFSASAGYIVAGGGLCLFSFLLAKAK